MSKTFLTTTDIFSFFYNDKEVCQNLTFRNSDIAFPYSEINSTYLNRIDTKKVIELNLLYRFSFLADELFESNISEKTKNLLVDIVIHLSSKIDLKKALNLRFIACELLTQMIIEGNYGLKAQNIVNRLKKINKSLLFDFILIVLEHFWGAYNEQNFYDSFTLFYPNGKIYRRKNKINEVILFLNEKRSELSELKLELIKEFLLPFDCQCTICFEKHFGLIDYEQTMILGEICIVE
ncbi:MAG: hypothetical protein WC963_05340 [Bacilli bacterium]